ncbi:MAG: hypothetical protein HS104_00215 [Polyangiaceae bacterium]|nr:hypothetical protein [Polyangiaceae bacterium]MCE7894064.1 hypothetical protein [Sorangiineae bacterium PRO1]MCL4752832.1 hypothetical protein [Myxococcales bacterium]
MKLGSSAALVLAAFAWSATATAQGTDELGPYGGLDRRHQFESPQNAAFELRFGPYRPEVDSEFGGAKPFDDTFGGDNRYLIGLEVDWQALRVPHFGSFGPGFGWGYTRSSADALLADGSGNRSAQTTTLNVMPMYLVGVLRVDVLAKETFVPLVPYAKAGFGYALWWSSDGDGTAHGDDGTAGRGASYGIQWALGGMLLLDVIDQTSAVEMDSTTGVNNSYFFMEWYRSQLGASGDQMNVGTNTWMLGLALEI